jgi:hypothetical protein
MGTRQTGQSAETAGRRPPHRLNGPGAPLPPDPAGVRFQHLLRAGLHRPDRSETRCGRFRERPGFLARGGDRQRRPNQHRGGETRHVAAFSQWHGTLLHPSPRRRWWRGDPPVRLVLHRILPFR